MNTTKFQIQEGNDMKKIYAHIYNSKTGKTTHKIQIDYDSYDLMIALNKAMLYMQHPNPFN